MRNILLNKIDEKLIAISRIKDSMDESAYDDKIYYENLIKSLTNEIKTLLDEFYSLTQKESKPLETLPMPKISYTEEGYIKMEIPFILRNSIVDFNKFSKVLSKYFSELLGKDKEFLLEDNNVFIKYVYEKSIDEKYFINTFDLSLYWELFFVNLPGNYNVTSGNFVGTETATEIYILPRESYKDFLKKYIFKETGDEKMKWRYKKLIKYSVLLIRRFG